MGTANSTQLWTIVNYATVPKCGEHLTTKYAFTTAGIEEDAPHRRDGSTPCLGDTHTILLLVVVPHNEAKGLKAHWPSIGARKGGPREGERIESQSSALAMTKHVTRLPFRQLLPPPPREVGGRQQSTIRWSMDTCSIMASWPSWGSLLGEFCPTVHFSWRTQPPHRLPKWCA